MADVVVLWRISMSCMSAVLWLSVSGARGEFGDRLRKVAVMSVTPARIISIENMVGMVTFVGNQVKVLQMHCAWVSDIHTV